MIISIKYFASTHFFIHDMKFDPVYTEINDPKSGFDVVMEFHIATFRFLLHDMVVMIQGVVKACAMDCYIMKA